MLLSLGPLVLQSTTLWDNVMMLCVCVSVHNAVVTAAVFAPNPSFIFRMAMADNPATALCFDDDTEDREIIVSADFTGAIKVITNRPKS